MRLKKARVNPSIFVAAAILLTMSNALLAALTFSGPVSISNVTTSGSVTVSSMTITSATITNLQILGTSNIKPGVVQIIFSSTTTGGDTTSTSFVAVSSLTSLGNFKCNITMSNAADYVRITLSANLNNRNSHFGDSYVTIFRDAIDLGNSNGSGLASAKTTITADYYNPIPITVVDSPNDTLAHTYTVAFRSTNSGLTTRFNTIDTCAYLVCEEIHP